jgi:hypothetical protein
VGLRHRVSATAAVSFALLGLTVVVGVLIAWFATDHGLRGWLYSFGGSAEFFGLLLVAAPELVPILQSIGAAAAGGWRSLRALQRKAAARLLRLLGRPQHQRVVVGAGGVTAGGHLSGSGRVSHSPGATLEGKVDYLLRRDQQVQDALERLNLSLEAMPGRWQAAIAETSETLRGEHSRALEQLREHHLQPRLLGILLLAVGVGLATAGNLV